MKKNVAKLLAGIIVCAMLAGCGGSEQKPEPVDQNSQAQAQELAQDDASAQKAQAQAQAPEARTSKPRPRRSKLTRPLFWGSPWRTFPRRP